jgi:hypothetical protein
MANVDPTQTGFVTFESFLDFMTRECSEEDSVDQLALAFKTLSGDKVNSINEKKTKVFLFSSFSLILQLKYLNENYQLIKLNGVCKE